MSLPVATSIGEYAFGRCAALESVSLPAATSIGKWAFSETGTAGLTVTLGARAPAIGVDMFSYYNTPFTKSVTVLVPSGATGYGTVPRVYDNTDTATNNWGNAFRGRGWDESGYGSGRVNSDITVTIRFK